MYHTVCLIAPNDVVAELQRTTDIQAHAAPVGISCQVLIVTYNRIAKHKMRSTFQRQTSNFLGSIVSYYEAIGQCARFVVIISHSNASRVLTANVVADNTIIHRSTDL